MDTFRSFDNLLLIIDQRIHSVNSQFPPPIFELIPTIGHCATTLSLSTDLHISKIQKST